MTRLPPCAVLSPRRAAGMPAISTLPLPATTESGGPVQVSRSPTRSAGIPPIITVIGIEFWFLLGGAVLVETIFAWGGIGQYAVESVVNSDYAPLQAVVLVTAVFTTLVFLIVDLLYHLLDPRISV